MAVDEASAEVEWAPGEVPVSARFGDSYYTKSDGLAETRHVFLEGNDLARRFALDGVFHIAELGFGTGLNFCATALLWAKLAPAGATLTFTSFEAFPMARDDMARALAVWPEIAGPAGCLSAAWPLDAANAATPGARPAASNTVLPGVTLQIIQGDARTTLPTWAGAADAWFLDGFAPARNPEMWEEPLLATVYRHTAPGGTFATYTAAGRVRRALAASGFDVMRSPGYGTKREMLTGRRP